MSPVRPVRAVVLAALAALAALVLVTAACAERQQQAQEPAQGIAASTTASTRESGDDSGEELEARGSAGCGVASDEDAVGDRELAFDIDGQPRTYRLAIPEGYDPDQPTPLVVNLHGSTSNAQEQSIYSRLPERGGARGYLVVAPDAGDGQWDFDADEADGRFVMALLDDLEQRYCVDLDRVHAAGMSLGAWFATTLACAHPERIASVALVTVEVFQQQCGATAVVAFHGTADHVVPYGEGSDPGVVVVGPNAGLPGARDNIAAWADVGGCGSEPAVDRVGEDVERWTYPDCTDGVDVVLYTVFGGGHTWPGAEVTIGPTTQTIDATELALDWFDAHPLTLR